MNLSHRRRITALMTTSAVVLGMTFLQSPSLASTLFGVVSTGEVFTSTDEGETWDVRASIDVHDAVAIGAARSSAEVVLATRSGSIYRSLDAASSWSAIGAVPASDLASIAFRQDGAILLLAERGSIYISLDQGTNWTISTALPSPNFVSLTRDDDGWFYAASRTGEIHRSTDGGSSWSAVGVVTAPNVVAIHAFYEDLFLLSATGDVWVSSDQGEGWIAIGTLSQVGSRALTDDGVLLVAAAVGGEAATSINGMAWTWRGTIDQLSLTALGSDIPRAVSAPEGDVDIAMGTPWPNPQVGAAVGLIPLRLRRPDRVAIDLYSASGRVVASRAPESLGAGEQIVRWTVGSLTPGVYLLRVRTVESGHTHSKWVITP